MSAVFTKYLVLGTLIGLVGLDVYLAFDGVPGNTISEVILKYTHEVVISVVLLVGFVLGHIFWSQRRK